MTTTIPIEELPGLVAELRAKDAKWQEQCDRWIKAAQAAGGVSAVDEQTLRLTWERKAADTLESLAAAHKMIGSCQRHARCMYLNHPRCPRAALTNTPEGGE